MTASVWTDAALLGVLGLLIGSFLNVVIHRLPRMMHHQWAQECAAWAAEQNGGGSGPESAPTGEPAPYNLLVPRSQCPHCAHPIRWFENIPVFSYLALRGRCAGCGKAIGLRYPAVELATGLLFFFCGLHWGLGPAGLAWSAFSAALVAAACIDWDTTLLPDDITLPLLWGGLLASLLHYSGVTLTDAVLGAMGGYLSLWSVYWGFKLATGKEGMGYGDFKLFAALGAWFGWQALVPIILLASVVGAVVGVVLKLRGGLHEGKYVPFGPFLAGGGFVALLWGPQQVMHALLGVLGLAA
ncbi:prepilin peptidase [Comamonas flocculans]|uniref:Prepilin leader peptidase/N-methyltransferase n=1 Tax=Comamonas flocculans TaxID=2597701 RepID=A0A5B8RQY6_9BURK|nr:A24 family peptidase [Comamonas flocculans]QEA12050.1 prepilin peptidase [Comamonas flocculans]